MNENKRPHIYEQPNMVVQLFLLTATNPYYNDIIYILNIMYFKIFIYAKHNTTYNNVIYFVIWTDDLK